MDGYTLGIIWSVGTLTEYGMRFRHNDRYFVEHMAEKFGNKPYLQNSRTGEQWAVKVFGVDIKELRAAGWTPRNAQERYFPIIPDHSAFIRAYIELHGKLDYCTAYARSGQKYRKLRLRIYGNRTLLIGMSQFISVAIGSSPKAVYRNTETSGTLFYTCFSDIRAIANLADGYPRHEEYWDKYYLMLQTPAKPYRKE